MVRSRSSSLALVLGFCLGAHLPASPAHAEPALAPSAVIVSLAAWGVASVDELAFAQVGVLATDPPRLIIYHLGAVDPTRAGDSDRNAPPPLSGGSFLLTPLDGDNRNRLGGLFNAIVRAPAEAEVTLEESAPGEGALAFRFDKRPGTFAGFWVHLFDTRAQRQDRVYLDGHGAAWLTFEVRGDAGGEPLRLQLADRGWEKKQDSWPIDDVGALLDGGPARIDTTWRRAWLALDRLDVPGSRLDRSRLASLVFLVDPEGHNARAGRIWIRDIAFTAERVAPVPPVPAKKPPPSAERKAMWLWETRRILDTAGELERLVAFCRAQAVSDLFVQLPYMEPLVDHQWSERWDEAGMRRMVAALSAAAVSVHALDGAPFYVRPEWGPRLATTVTQVVAYNRASRPAERFAGIRFDIEPYLLAEWQGIGKQAVLRDYTALLAALAPKARAGGLAFGVDIPFWFDGRDEVTGELAAPLDGRPVLERILDSVDDIGLMDYRTGAFGADGVVAHGADELALASARGKRVFIGLETVRLPDERLVTCDTTHHGEALVFVPLGDGRAEVSILAAGAPRPAGAKALGVRESIVVPADKITFANRGRQALERTMALARPALATSPSFLGFALHSYESLAPWYR